MSRTGKVTLYEGVAKASKKPFTALRIEVGSFTKLYFDLTPFEKEYVVNYLKGDDQPTQSTPDTTLDLNTEDPINENGFPA